jgi:putative transposase
VEGLRDHLRKRKDIPEIPKSQRFMNRPELNEIFTVGAIRNRRKRDEKLIEAVERHGYTQREGADFLGLHFTSVSRILNQKRNMPRKYT